MLTIYGAVHTGFSLLSLVGSNSPNESIVCGGLMAFLALLVNNLKAGKGLAATVICALALLSLPLTCSQAALVYGFTALYFTVLWSEVPKLTLSLLLQVSLMGLIFLEFANCLNSQPAPQHGTTILAAQLVLFMLLNLSFRLMQFLRLNISNGKD